MTKQRGAFRNVPKRSISYVLLY